MKTTTLQRRPLWAILALVASLFVALLITAPGVQANIGAGATILNTVRVDYYDASGTTGYAANASTFTTVNLVRAGLTLSGRPTSGSPGKTALCPPNQTVDSGATQSYLIALTANANGGDTYNLTGLPGTITNMASYSVTWATMRNDGTTQITGSSPATVALGSSVIQRVPADNQIEIPGNSNLVALITDNTTTGKVLVVNGVDYIVTGISDGTAPSNTHTGNTYWNTAVAGTPETLAVITLAANTAGSNTTPAFLTDGTARGQVVAEQILVRLNYSGTATLATDGVVNWQLRTTDGASGNTIDSCNITTTFRGMNLQVQKSVRNCGPLGTTCPGSYSASTTGNPGDVLEYQVLVNNVGGSVAKLVTGTDAVPVYTRLICGAAYGGNTVCTGTATDIFATVTVGANTVSLTYTNDAECAGTPRAAGNAGGFAENSSLNFYLGNTCNGSGTPVGGDVTSGQLYTILYRVKMN